MGAQLRYEFAADRTLSPYLSASAQYTHNGAVPATPAGSSGTARYQQMTLESNAGQFGGGAGLRYRLSSSLALFGEGRVMYTTFPMGSWDGWSSVDPRREHPRGGGPRPHLPLPVGRGTGRKRARSRRVVRPGAR